MADMLWDDLKIAFAIDDPDPLDVVLCPWKLKRPHKLPVGWTLCEINGSGARWVAVFRVQVMPSTSDAEKIIRLLQRLKAIRLFCV